MIHAGKHWREPKVQRGVLLWSKYDPFHVWNPKLLNCGEKLRVPRTEKRGREASSVLVSYIGLSGADG